MPVQRARNAAGRVVRVVRGVDEHSRAVADAVDVMIRSGRSATREVAGRLDRAQRSRRRRAMTGRSAGATRGIDDALESDLVRAGWDELRYGDVAIAERIGAVLRARRPITDGAHRLLAMLGVERDDLEAAIHHYGETTAAARPAPSMTAERWLERQVRYRDFRRGRVDESAPVVTTVAFDVNATRAQFRALVTRELESAESFAPWRAAAREIGSLRPRDPMPPAAIAPEIRTVSLPSLRNRLKGRGVVVVAGNDAPAASDDVVIRVDDFEPSPGARTDLHVTRRYRRGSWDVPADIRIVLSESANRWRSTLRDSLVPGAQAWVSDATLRWPWNEVELVPGIEPSRHSTAMLVLGLLERLNVSPQVTVHGALEDGTVEPDVATAELAWIEARGTRDPSGVWRFTFDDYGDVP